MKFKKSIISIISLALLSYNISLSKAEDIKNKSIGVSVLLTGLAENPEFLVYESGGLKKHFSAHTAFYVKHPKGDFLFETGLGSDINDELNQMSFIDRFIFNHKKFKSASEQFKDNGIDTNNINKIFLSHLHWDHASGVRDFPKAKVYTTNEEINFALSSEAKPPSFLKIQYESEKSRFETIKFEDKYFMGFNESLDLYNDQSVVFVKLYGHTKGSMGMFLRLSSGTQLFFVGDSIWSNNQIKLKTNKNFIASSIVDNDKKLTRKVINKLIQFNKKYNDIKIIPTHDYEAVKTLAFYPNFID